MARIPRVMDRLKSLATLLVLAALYVAAGKLGLSLAFLHHSASPVWPPTGIALTAVLLLGYRVWPAILLGAFVVNITTEGTAMTSIGIAVGNALEAISGAYLVNRYAGGHEAFNHARNVFRFVFLAALASTAISATFGVTSLAMGGLVSWSGVDAIWATWWLGDTGGALLVAPMVLIWATVPVPGWTQRQVIEGLILLSSVLLVGVVIFGDRLPLHLRPYAQPYLCAPVLLWASFRFRQHGAITATFTLAAISLWATLRGLGPLASDEPNTSLLLWQMFAGVSVVTMLVLASLAAEQEQSAADLLRQVRQTQVILDTLPIGVMIAHDPDCRRITGNNWANELLRMPPASNLSKSAPSDELPVHYRVCRAGQALASQDLPIQQAARGQTIRDAAVDHCFDDGTVIPTLVSATPLSDDRGKVRGVVATIMDVTERKLFEGEIRKLAEQLEQRVIERTAELGAANASLRQAGDRLEAIVSHAADGIITITERGIIESYNPAAECMFGYAPQEAIGQNVKILMRADDAAHHDRYLDNYLRTGKSRIIGVGRELVGRRRDGSTFPLDLTVSELHHRTVRSFVGIVRDLTERRRTESEVRMLERTLAEISTREQRRIGRELHDQIGQILSGSAMLARSLEQRLARLEADGARNAACLVEQLTTAYTQVRNLSRGLAPVMIQDRDLGIALADLAESTESVYGVESEYSGEPALSVRSIEVAEHLYRIAQEAVSNAVRHAQPGHIWIRFRQNSDRLELAVQDDGIGLRSEELRTEGLGLRIMRHRAQLIGAQLEIGPAAPRGTLVCCLLSVDNGRERSPAGPASG